MTNQEKKNCSDVLEHYFRFLFRFDFKKLTVSGLVMAIVLRLLLLVLFTQTFVNYLVPSFEKHVEIPEEIKQQAASYQALEEANKVIAKGGSEVFVFINPWIAKDNNSYVDSNSFLHLHDSKTSSIYEYRGSVPQRIDYGLSFVFKAVYGPNVVIIRPGFYEITIGDMSSRVVTLKATDKIGGQLLPIGEFNFLNHKISDPFRPATKNCQFISGEEIKSYIATSFNEGTRKFKVDVTVTCNDGLSDTFSWIFTPPPKWNETEVLQLAILDNSSAENGTKIDFLGLNLARNEE